MSSGISCGDQTSNFMGDEAKWEASPLWELNSGSILNHTII